MELEPLQIVEQTLFAAVPLVFTLLHLLFYAFSRERKEHLIFAGMTAVFAVAAHGEVAMARGSVSAPMLGIQRTAVITIIVLGVLFYFALHNVPTPKVYRALAGVAGLCILTGWVRPQLWIGGITVVGAASFVVIFLHRATGVARTEGRSILNAGLLVAVGGGTLDLLIDFGLPFPQLGANNPWLYGVLGLLVAMAVYLASDMASTNRKLEARLVEVQELSARTLEQERAASRQEIARRILEADNRRKTEELAHARELQLSLLPQQLPSSRDWELAAAMVTATEVGGDYYDFEVGEHGALTIAVGDAVGHGARAGALVAATKGLFLSRPLAGDVGRCLDGFDRALARLAIDRSFVALLIARLEANALSVASAGVPPPLVLRGATGEVEEVDVGGMPLGSPIRSKHRSQRVDLLPGDTLLFMTDGLPELPDDQGSELGYETVRQHFARCRSLAPREIVDRLTGVVTERTSGEPPADDVTVVVVRVAA